ncbi:MAG: glycoside hydrolase family 2 [Chloroflexi bacterium]|nr:MAG: glycoside hydrolase family 2 [Chloroflexota bacterium]
MRGKRTFAYRASVEGTVGPGPEYPRPNLRREEWSSLDGEWEFGAGANPVFDRRIVVPFCPESALSGIGERVGDVVWYRRRFDAPGADRLHLHFGAVDYQAIVWVNDVEVARHEGGHSPFTADITAAVRARDNVVVVRAEDPLADMTIPRGKQHWTETPEGIFYTATTGIWQSVWLEPLPAHHVRGVRLIPDLDAGAVDVVIEADGPADVVVDLDEEDVGRWSGNGGGRIRLDEVEAWSPESPRLYGVEVRLGADLVRTCFGLRKVEVRDGRCWLNGEPLTQRLILDQGYFPEGLLTAPSIEDLRRDIELAKALGFNGARKHQKAEDPRWLYLADVLGFLVWAEMPSFHQFSDEAMRRLAAEWTEIVRRDRDHPSVVTWVVANESFGLDGVDAGVRSGFTSGLRRITRELDESRPVVSNDGWEHSLSDLCTLHDYSPPADLARRYRSVETALDGTGSAHPPYDPGFGYRGEPIIVSEFGGLRLAGSGGWGWLEVPDDAAFVGAYGQLIAAFMQRGPVEGFCYTQLTDVEQEQNGLLTAQREPKVDPARLRPMTQTPKRR